MLEVNIFSAEVGGGGREPIPQTRTSASPIENKIAEEQWAKPEINLHGFLMGCFVSTHSSPGNRAVLAYKWCLRAMFF